jgi:hypothetical protein
MGARSAVEVVDQPWPVVYDAFVRSLPTRGFRITSTDPQRGRIGFHTRNTRFVLAVGAVDGVTTEWVATAELKIGLLPDRHEQHFAAIREALADYLDAYYRV